LFVLGRDHQNKISTTHAEILFVSIKSCVVTKKYTPQFYTAYMQGKQASTKFTTKKRINKYEYSGINT